MIGSLSIIISVLYQKQCKSQKVGSCIIETLHVCTYSNSKNSKIAGSCREKRIAQNYSNIIYSHSIITSHKGMFHFIANCSTYVAAFKIEIASQLASDSHECYNLIQSPVY